MIARLINTFFSYTFLYHMGRLVRFLKFKSEPKIVFDVGAYKGQFGNSFKKSEVFFFEPNKEFFKNLKKNKKDKYFNLGIGEQISKKSFYIMPNASSSSFNKPTLGNNLKTFFFFKILNEKYKKVNVKIYPLNFFFKKYNLKKIDILKIDTEGFEKSVLKGISKINFKKINYIIVEKQLDKKLYKNYSFVPIKKILLKHNFLLIKRFKDPVWSYEDHVYENKNFVKKK